MGSPIVIRPLREADLDAANAVFRRAFGTFLRLPDPMAFAGDGDPLRMRWRADPDAAFVAEQGGRVVGSNLAVRWGSVGFFGPLSVHPDLWNQQVGQRLMVPIIDCFARWGTTLTGLFTFAESTKHVGLYQRFGFWPRQLTIVMARKPTANASGELSTVGPTPDETVLAACRDVTDGIYPGLDLSSTIHHLARERLGDTVLVHADGRIVGFAACYCGPGGDAVTGECFVKFGAVRSGTDAPAHLTQLLDAVDRLAIARGLRTVVAGINTARLGAYRLLLARGFRAGFQGVTMSRDAAVGYDRPDTFVLDDWR